MKWLIACAVALTSIAALTSATYTPAQAQLGKAIFMQKCAECHGASLQGLSAPALTGPDSGISSLSISQVRAIVTQQMPLGNPGSITPTQYAAVIAFILKRNCVAPSNSGNAITIGSKTCP